MTHMPPRWVGPTSSVPSPAHQTPGPCPWCPAGTHSSAGPHWWPEGTLGLPLPVDKPLPVVLLPGHEIQVCASPSLWGGGARLVWPESLSCAWGGKHDCLTLTCTWRQAACSWPCPSHAHWSLSHWLLSLQPPCLGLHHPYSRGCPARRAPPHNPAHCSACSRQKLVAP